jgi:hypothetical protein
VGNQGYYGGLLVIMVLVGADLGLPTDISIEETEFNPVTYQPAPTPNYFPYDIITNNTQQKRDLDMVNGIWIHDNDIGSINYATLSSSGITDIFMKTAHWSDSHTLAMDLSSGEISTLLSSAHAVDIKVHAWTLRYWSSGESPLEIATEYQRTSCINSVISLMQTSYGGQTFDGHNDDLAEHYSGTWANYVSYITDLSVLLHSISKISSTDMLVYTGYPVADRFPSLDECDYVCGMFYQDIEHYSWSGTELNYLIPIAFTASATDLVIGLQCDTRMTPTSFAQQLTAISDTYNSEEYFGGFSLYCGDNGEYAYVDLASFAAWDPKDDSETTPKCATPTFNPAGSSYSSTQNVTISCVTPSVTIYYTTNGDVPDSGDTEYSGAIEISSTTMLKAIATKADYDNSAVGQAYYLIGSVDVVTLPLSEDFTNLNDWETASGSWYTSANVCYGSGDGTTLITSGDTAWDDYYVEANLTVLVGSPNSEAALVIRCADSSNYYYMGIGCFSALYCIAKNVSGVASQLAVYGSSEDVVQGTTYKVKAVIVGSTLALYIDDVQVLETTDSTFAAGKLGIRSFYGSITADTLAADETSTEPDPVLTPSARAIIVLGY